MLLKLLDSENEMIVGNAALCLGQCLVVPGAATSLLNSSVVMILLKHAGGDARRTSVQENAAIALGKLCVAEPRYCKKECSSSTPSVCQQMIILDLCKLIPFVEQAGTDH